MATNEARMYGGEKKKVPSITGARKIGELQAKE